MILSKCPDCCAIGILHHLDVIRNRQYNSSDAVKFKEGVINRLNKAKFVDNRAFVMANYSSDQESFIKRSLEELGFDLIKEVRNPNTNNQIYTYIRDCSTLPTRKFTSL